MKKYRFRRWLRNWITQFDADEPLRAEMSTTKVQAGRTLGDHREAINFRICRATGGYIVECSIYDRKLDEHDRNLHIITDDQDLGEAIAKIVTIEMLRN